jgi:hypothetical protein
VRAGKGFQRRAVDLFEQSLARHAKLPDRTHLVESVSSSAIAAFTSERLKKFDAAAGREANARQ